MFHFEKLKHFFIWKPYNRSFEFWWIPSNPDKVPKVLISIATLICYLSDGPGPKMNVHNLLRIVFYKILNVNIKKISKPKKSM